MGESELVEGIESSPVLAGIPADEAAALLAELGASARSFKRRQVIFHIGDRLSAVPVIVYGSVEARMLGKDGNYQILAQFHQGESFAEAIPVSMGAAPVEARALEDSRIILIPFDALRKATSPAAARLHANIMAEMSKKVGTLTGKLALLSEPRLRARIEMYLRSLPADEEGFVQPPFNRKGLADYLVVNDKALLRELKRMRDEGLLEEKGHRMRLVASSNRRP